MDTSFRWSSYIPTSGFQYIFKHLNLNRGLLIFSNKEQFVQNGETLANYLAWKKKYVEIHVQNVDFLAVSNPA